MKTALTLFLLGFVQVVAMSQLSPVVMQLKQHVQKDTLVQDSLSRLNPLYNSKGLNYLQPISRQLKVGAQTKTDKLQGKFAGMAQDFAFAGDYAAAAEYGPRDYDSMPAAGYQDARMYIDTLKSIRYNNARNYILTRAAEEQVIMINETRYLPEHRAFTLSLLKDLYLLGYRYLATDLLNNRSDRQLTDIDMRTGYFAAEPVAGELLRKALEMGFNLVAYEDTLADNHSGTGRDAIQAARIASILQKDPSAKILVHAGQAHISEDIIGQSYIPMAVAFRRFTGINPFTIDQTELTTGSTFEYGRYFYDLLRTKISGNEPVIAFRKEQPVSLLENGNYDIQVIHPPTIPIHNRPGWLSINKGRKEVAVQPTEKALFLVQAYYLNETISKPISVLIPADQTYVLDRDGYYWLFLFPGKYKLVLRDMDYNILSEKEIDMPG
ncbi:hypothetical protein [Flavihumibacter fluvii]|uniref:hypothetical protein n=1 Tax=Flavihumibacter fluvii TaxID=2838157 RepID=UPI001BDE6463|nr:hypothetical protein [Flavihumibacter fluvii]ULQ53970.1 hypothetical protein KJS93_06515 [Flavihumibacter fluvii]